MANREIELFKWLAEGYDKGFCSDLYCQNHDMVQSEDSELFDSLMDEDDMDFCWPVIRVKTGIYRDLEQVRKSIEPIESIESIESYDNVLVVDFGQAIEEENDSDE